MKLARRAALALLLLATVLSGAPAGAQADPEIIGGRRADPGEYPFQVALLFHGTGDRWANQFCGGTLISPDTVLTAGHCVVGARPGDIDVLAGTNRLLPGNGRRVRARAIRLHPGYDETGPALENDIAIVQLGTNLPYPTVRPAVPGDEALYPEGTMATTIGWGDRDIRLNQQIYPTHLREVEVPIVGDPTCVDVYGDEVVAEQAVCAGDMVDGGEDSCYGDSGGPLMVPDGDDWVQVGIVSTGRGCARRPYPGIYTEVLNYDDLVGRYTQPDTVPDRVTNLRRQVVGEGAVRLTWRAPFFDGGTRITRYHVAVPSLDRAHAVAGDQTRFRLRNLPPGEHTVNVRAINVHGASAVRAITVRVPA